MRNASLLIERFAVLALVSALAPRVTGSSGRFDLDALVKLVNVSEPGISPDGKSIVVLVSRPNYEDNRNEADLVLVEVATGAQRVLTRDRLQLRHARWSPGGDRLAFLAAGGPEKEATPQVFVMPMHGGDALRLTNAPSGVSHFAWRPDGAWLAYVTTDEPPKSEGPERHNRSFEVGNNHYLMTEAPRPSHLWLVPATGGEPRRLTSGEWSLYGEPWSPTEVSWLPDGRSIVFVSQARPYSGEFDQRALQIVDVETGALREITPGARFANIPIVSPDGAAVAYWHARDGDPMNVNEIHLVATAGGSSRSLTRALDRDIWRAFWMPDGKALLVGANDHSRTSLWLQPTSGPARQLDLAGASPAGLFWLEVDVGRDGSIAFVGSEPNRPLELYHLSSPAVGAKRLTDFNREVASLDLGRVETIEWKTHDGLRANGILVYPPGFDPARRYPLVLWIHGGPALASKEEFLVGPRLVAGRGYLVLQPNYRGSNNLGNAFRRAVFGDAGEGPGRDVMAGIEELKKRPFVDTNRMAVSGGSYGGFMTTWLIGRYPGVFRAAVAAAALTDWMDEYNLSDYNVATRYDLGGSPWLGNGEDLYRAQSPITHAPKIRTPTLLLATTGDTSVPVTQSYKLFHALKDNGVPVQFIAYPLSAHFPSDPVHLRDLYRRWLGWLDRYLASEGTQD